MSEVANTALPRLPVSSRAARCAGGGDTHAGRGADAGGGGGVSAQRGTR